MLQGALQLQTSQTRRRHIGRTQSRRNGSVRTLSSRPREEPQEGCGLGTLAATNLDSEHNEVAARRARMLGVGVATLTLRCLLEADCRLLAAARRSESVKRTKCYMLRLGIRQEERSSLQWPWGHGWHGSIRKKLHANKCHSDWQATLYSING